MMGGVQEVLAWLELIHSRVPSLWTPEKTPETANFLGCPLALEAWKGSLVGLVVFSAEVGGSGARIPVFRIRIQISAQLAQPLGRSKGDSLDLVEWGRIWGRGRASLSRCAGQAESKGLRHFRADHSGERTLLSVMTASKLSRHSRSSSGCAISIGRTA